VIDAFAKLKHALVVVGDGPLKKLMEHRASSNITFTGWLSDAVLDDHYRRCRAVIVPNEEDWGLTIVEAMAHGKPVLALRRGGALETVVEGVTGEFFDDPIPEALADGIKRLTMHSPTYDIGVIRARAGTWGTAAFESRMRSVVYGADGVE
jgi:glycosyltransferase involved in cell wall biosynthesis